jgi:hypothetical protein
MLCLRRQAKLDSLSVLGACAQQWGYAPLSGHVSAIWAALRLELLPAAGAAAGAPMAPSPPAGGGDEVRGAAAKCLSQCLEVTVAVLLCGPAAAVAAVLRATAAWRALCCVMLCGQLC